MTQAFWIFALFLFGLLFGSFLNVVIYRIDELETIWLSRSHCPKCRHILAWYDLVPFFSFILLKTRCRYCQKPISWQYPLVEVATALVFAFSYSKFVAGGLMSVWAFLPLMIVFGSWIVIFVHDLKTMTIPIEILLVGALFSLIYLFIRFDWLIFTQAIAAAALMALVPLVIIGIGKLITKKEVMGTGDIFLAGSLGLLLNINTGILAMLTSFIIGGIISLVLILAKKVKLGLYEEIAFGPFLVIGTLIALWWGEDILSLLIYY